MFLVAMAMAMALGAEDAGPPVTLPRALPERGTILIEHRDERSMPDGGSAVFREGSRLVVEPAGNVLIVTMEAAGRSCEGPPAICRAFFRLGGAVDGQRHRFRVSLADYGIMAEGAFAVPLPVGQSAAASEIGVAVAAREGAEPGSVLAADLRHLLRFAALTLPGSGWIDAPEGRLRVSAADAGSLTLLIERPAVMGEAMTVNGSGECRVSRSTGLVEHCRYRDWMGDNEAQPVRERTVSVTITSAPVP